MNPTLVFRDRLSQISQSLVDEFDQLIANIGTGWAVEHDDQGHHTTIAASGPCTCAQLKLRGFVTLDLTSGSGGTPLAVPANVSWVSILTPNPGPIDIYGIRQVGQQFGDILFIRRSPLSTGGTIQFHDRATAAATPLGTETYLDSEVAVSYPIFHLTGSWVPLVYSPDAGTNRTGAWSFLQIVSS